MATTCHRARRGYGPRDDAPRTCCSFGGAVAFIFADLIILPILLIYRKYYGTKAMVRIAITFYAAMVLAGYLVELVFGTLGFVPVQRHAQVAEAAVTWNYTTWLNILAIVLSGVFLLRFVRTGGVPMLKMMGGAPKGAEDKDGAGSAEHTASAGRRSPHGH